MGNVECEHRCRNTCAMLNDALRSELARVKEYEKMLVECDDPEMLKFVRELVGTHKAVINSITERLDVIKANAGVLDDIISGFEG